MTREEFLILKAKVIARRALLAEMTMSETGDALKQEQMGVLLMMAACHFEQTAHSVVRGPESSP